MRGTGHGCLGLPGTAGGAVLACAACGVRAMMRASALLALALVLLASLAVDPAVGQDEQWPRNEGDEEDDDDGAAHRAQPRCVASPLRSTPHVLRAAAAARTRALRLPATPAADDPNVDENEMDPMKWANRVTKRKGKKKEEKDEEREIDEESGLPKAKVQAHRTLKPEDLSYDFLAKMGFVPPPPPPPWGFNKDGNSTSEIEERVMRCVTAAASLSFSVLLVACAAPQHTPAETWRSALRCAGS
jgi:hypothetical protein